MSIGLKDPIHNRARNKMFSFSFILQFSKVTLQQVRQKILLLVSIVTKLFFFYAPFFHFSPISSVFSRVGMVQRKANCWARSLARWTRTADSLTAKEAWRKDKFLALLVRSLVKQPAQLCASCFLTSFASLQKPAYTSFLLPLLSSRS